MLDIRSKNNKETLFNNKETLFNNRETLFNNKKALFTAVVITVLASVCFVLISLNCKNTADIYYMQSSNDFEGEFFINILFQSNYVLYPEVLEKSGKNVRPEDLYLSFEEEAIPETVRNVYVGNEIEYGGSSEEIRVEHVAELQNNLLRINSLYTAEIGMQMDYCVIDENTQTILKNTTREIELLKERDNAQYVYYFIVCYDQNGIISDIKVSGSNTEQFLKNAQLAANSTDSLPLAGKQKTSDYVLINDVGVANRKITITQKNPQNTTFIYAMTAEQSDHFESMAVYGYDETGSDSIWVTRYIRNDDKRMVYYRIGIGRAYLLFLAVLTLIVFFLVRYKPQRTADTAGTRYPMELVFGGQWMIATVLYWTVVNFVYILNESISYTVVTKVCALLGLMFFLFGAWYWCLLSIRGIFKSPRTFFKERSLILRYWDRIKTFFKKICDRWKEDLADADLAKDIKKPLKKLIVLQFVILSFICCCWAFGIFILILYSFVLYWGLKRYIGKIQAQYTNLMQATNAIAQGKFDNSFEGSFGVFQSYKSELYQIQRGFRTAVEEEVKSQRMKTELITNVSHDLKTPLTAIITYIDLLKEENTTSEQRMSYLETLERKSLRLKVLIEDLFEISKASSGNVKLEPVAVDICNLMRQVYLEHEDKMRANGLDVRFDLPEEKIILQLDSQKTFRIFENLFVNVTKYAMLNTRVYVQAKMVTTDKQKKIHIEIKNISAQELTVNSTDLTERFVRGDASRNTEGSGLGLAIARSFTELQGGRFGIDIDGDLFKAILEWDVACVVEYLNS